MSEEIERMAERSFRESIALGRIEQRIAEEKRMGDDTQPLKLLEAPTPEEELERARKAWNDQLHHSLQQAMIGVRDANMPLPLPDPHIHGPFTFLLNQNHNALRGCTTCGAAWV